MVHSTLKPQWFNLPEVKKVADALNSANIDFLFFGGIVRDSLSYQSKIREIDIVANAETTEILSAFHAAGIEEQTSVSDKIHFRMGGIIFDIIPVDRTVFEYKIRRVGRGVRPVDLEAFRTSTSKFTDAMIKHMSEGSDITINSMYLRYNGELFDFYNGADDFKNGRIICLPEHVYAVWSKPTVMLRYFRFYAYYNKSVPDHESLQIYSKFAYKLKKKYLGLAKNIHREMILLFGAPDPYESVALMHRYDVLKHACGFRVKTLEPLKRLMQYEKLTGSNPNAATRFAALILGCEGEPLEALSALVERIGLDSLERSRIEVNLKLSASLQPYMSGVQRMMMREMLAEQAFVDLVMLRSLLQKDEASGLALLRYLLRGEDALLTDETIIKESELFELCADAMQYQSMRGYSILEVSVVVLVIALFSAAVLSGNELYKSQKLKRLGSKIEGYNNAVGTFRTKYGCLPGDCSKTDDDLGLNEGAYSAQGLAGNNDGYLGAREAAGWSPTGSLEIYNFFVYLYRAKLINDELVDMRTLSGVYSFPLFYIPKSEYGESYIPLCNRTCVLGSNFTIANFKHGYWITSGFSTFQGETGSLDTFEAKTLDNKFDDGLPATGNYIAVANYIQTDLILEPPAAVCSNSNQYQSSDNPKACNMVVLAPF